MKTYYDFRNRILHIVGVVSLLVFLMARFTGNISFAFSVIAGAVTGMVHFYLLSRDIVSMVGLNSTLYLLKKSGLRYFVLALFFIVFMNRSWFSLIPFLGGLMMIQVFVIFEVGFRKKIAQEKIRK